MNHSQCNNKNYVLVFISYLIQFYPLTFISPMAICRREFYMTNEQKEQIENLRSLGKSYSIIANALHMPKNTVKSYCRRNGIISIAMEKPKSSSVCDNCGKPLIQTPGARKKRFCCDKCRMQWWASHPEAMQRKTVYHFTCPVCGKEFVSYDNPKRIYCSRACFGVARKTTCG